MKTLTVKYVADEINALLRAHPELLEDAVFRSDTIEGSTDAFEFLSQTVRKVASANKLVRASADYIEDLHARKARFERREEALRGLIVKIMNTANITKAELPEATLSIRDGQQKVMIINFEEIPDEFMRIKKEPDKIRIKAAMTANEKVPGAALSNAEPVLSIRVR